jgi:predicted MFS family arabinose efflux permease
MLGPAIAVFLAGAYLSEHRRREGLLLSCMAGAILGGRVIERLLTPNAGASWVSPLMAVCFTAYLLVRFFRERQGQDNKNKAFEP